MHFTMVRIAFVLVLVALCHSVAAAQRQQRPRMRTAPPAVPAKPAEVGTPAIVLDETLAVLRVRPSLFAPAIHRMRRGRKVQILETTEADGVKFFRVSAPPSRGGWVQADAVFGQFRPEDEERLARYVQAMSGFGQIEAAIEFFKLYPTSRFRPSLLLLYGDLLEEVAVKLSRDANAKLSRREMAASGAPLHSYYLNFVSLDRYRKLGITFLLNSSSRQFHYDGASWKEIVAKFPSTPEAVEAQNRLATLKEKMARVPSN